MGVARSGIGWFVASVLALGASWLAAVYFTRALVDPQATLGKFYLFETVVSFLSLLANAGTNAAITKRVSAAADVVERDQFVGAGLVVSAVLLGIGLVVAVGALPLYPRYFEEGIVVGLFVIALATARQVRTTATAILQGVSKVGRTGAIGLVDAAGRAVAQVALVFLGAGFVGLMAGSVIGSGIAAVVGVAMVRVGVSRPTREQVWSVVAFAKNAVVSGFTTKFYDNIDIVVITSILGFDDTGVYGIGYRFALPIQVFSGAISSAIFPELSEQISEQNTARAEEVFTDALVFSTLLAIPATVGVAVLAEPLIVTVYTPEFAGAALVATVGVGIQIPHGVQSVFNTTLNALDRPDVPARGGFILVGVNLVLDLLLVPTVGIVGAIVASLLGITAAATYLGYHALAELGLGWRALPLRQFGAELGAALVMGGVVYWLRVALPLRVIPTLAVAIPTGVVVYFLVVVGGSAGIRERLFGIAGDVLPV